LTSAWDVAGNSPLFRLFELEDVDRFGVAAAAQELAARAERQAGYVDATLDAAPEFVQLLTVRRGEHSDDRSLLRSGGDSCAVRVESERRQGTVMSGNHCFGVQLIGIENLHFSIVGRTGIRQKTVIVGYAQRTQTVGIRRRISDRVQHLHVADVVDVETLLEADDESRPENVSI
jgi:hypothetical protein